MMSILKQNPFSLFVALSLMLHLVLLFNPFKESEVKNTSLPNKSKKLTYISLAPKIKPLPMPQHRQIKLKNQVVNSEESRNAIRPQDSRFLGRKNQTFKQQQVAKRVGSFKESALGNSNHSITAPTKKVAQQKKTTKKISLKDLGLGNLLLSQASAAIEQPSNRQLGSKQGKKNHHGLAQNNDFINDIPLGDTTYLNTVEFKYFGFYERIRKRLEIFWGTSIQQKAQQIFAQGRRLPASRNLITSLQITINRQGIIEHITIQSSSGFNELDQAAIDSFNQAGPFPNPPKGMLKNGKAIIEWGFVVNQA